MDNTLLIVKTEKSKQPFDKMDKKQKPIKAMHTFLNFEEH